MTLEEGTKIIVKGAINNNVTCKEGHILENLP